MFPSCWQLDTEVTESQCVHTVVDISISNAWSAPGIIGVERKNILIAVTLSTVSPSQPGLLQAQVRVTDFSLWSIATVVWTRHSQVPVCGFQKWCSVWALRQTVLRPRPIKYSGIQLPERTSRTWVSVHFCGPWCEYLVIGQAISSRISEEACKRWVTLYVRSMYFILAQHWVLSPLVWNFGTFWLDSYFAW